MLLHHATLHLHGVLMDAFSSDGVKNGSLLSRAYSYAPGNVDDAELSWKS